MRINSFYAENVQRAVENSSKQIVGLAMKLTAQCSPQCSPHWIELSVSSICSHLRATPRTNFNYARATGASSKGFFFAKCLEILWRE